MRTHISYSSLCSSSVTLTSPRPWTMVARVYGGLCQSLNMTSGTLRDILELRPLTGSVSTPSFYTQTFLDKSFPPNLVWFCPSTMVRLHPSETGRPLVTSVTIHEIFPFIPTLSPLVCPSRPTSVTSNDFNDVSKCSVSSSYHDVLEWVPRSTSDPSPPLLLPPFFGLVRWIKRTISVNCPWITDNFYEGVSDRTN